MTQRPTISDVPPAYGLTFDVTLGGVSQFAVEPDLAIIEKLARHHLGIPCSALCRLALLKGFQEVFTKVYRVDVLLGPLVRAYAMRVAIPVDMPVRVESEVATMDFVRRHTDAPIPTVHAYDATNDNELRFPWILMDYAPGRQLDHVAWRHMSMDSKLVLAKQLAQFQAQLLHHRFDVIGSFHHHRLQRSAHPTPHTCPTRPATLVGGYTLGILLISFFLCYPALTMIFVALFLNLRPSGEPLAEERQDESDPFLGRIVSKEFILCRNSGSRGPFFSTADWLCARLRDVQAEYVRDLVLFHAERDIEFTEKHLSFTTRLLALVPRFFPKPFIAPEPTFLFLEGLTDGHVIVDELGRLTGLVGFHNMYTAPLWMVCQTPQILHSWKMRIEAPPMDPALYPLCADGSPEFNVDILGSGVCCFYFDDLAQYERTELEVVYQKEVAELWNGTGGEEGWMMLSREETKRKRDFLRLVDAAERTDVYDPEQMYAWLDVMEKGQSAAKLFRRPMLDNNGMIDEDEDEAAQEAETKSDQSDDNASTSGSDDEENDVGDTTRVDSGDEFDRSGHFDDRSDVDAERTLYYIVVNEATLHKDQYAGTLLSELQVTQDDEEQERSRMMSIMAI